MNIKKFFILISRRIRTGRHKIPIDLSTMPDVNCLCCGMKFRGEFCPCCGQPAKTDKLTFMQGASDLLGIFTNFDSGFLHTVLELLYRPGYMMNDYLSGRRSEYVKPMQLLFLLGTCQVIISYILYGKGIELENMTAATAEASTRIPHMVTVALEWLKGNPIVSMLLLLSLLVVPNWLSYRLTPRGHGMTMAEHFFLIIYMACQLMTIKIIFILLFCLADSNPYDNLGMWKLPFFIILDSMQFYGIGLFKSILLFLLSVLILTIGGGALLVLFGILT